MRLRETSSFLESVRKVFNNFSLNADCQLKCQDAPETPTLSDLLIPDDSDVSSTSAATQMVSTFTVQEVSETEKQFCIMGIDESMLRKESSDSVIIDLDFIFSNKSDNNNVDEGEPLSSSIFPSLVEEQSFSNSSEKESDNNEDNNKFLIEDLCSFIPFQSSMQSSTEVLHCHSFQTSTASRIYLASSKRSKTLNQKLLRRTTSIDTNQLSHEAQRSSVAHKSELFSRQTRPSSSSSKNREIKTTLL